MNPIAALAAAIRDGAPGRLILVDSVSGLGAVPFEMDAWGVDLVVTGSQKAWMAAPGLAMVAASERGWAATETARMPRFYLDLRSHRESAAARPDPVHARDRGGLPGRRGHPADAGRGQGRVFARHEACAAASRAGLRALGFELFADEPFASRTVTAAKLPEGHDWKTFNGAIKAHGVVLAGGQGKLDRQDLPASNT